MKAVAVIGANYGDEGKGLMVDYFASKYNSIVVRFNGGAQAGHTVVTPEGRRHIFSHIGSGSFVGAPTYLSQFFLVNPMVWGRELSELGHTPMVFVHYLAPLTTIFDVLLNQASANILKHGTCGLGISETVVRNRNPRYATSMLSTLDMGELAFTLYRIREEYVPMRGQVLGLSEETIAEIQDNGKNSQHWYLRELQAFKDRVGFVRSLAELSIENVIFEGAQGLELCETRPTLHNTHSVTGVRNVAALLEEIRPEVTSLELVYVTRTYLTRHGNGPLPGEDPTLRYLDDTNVSNRWQGSLRFAPLNIPELIRNIREDWWDNGMCAKWNVEPSIAFTHLDQCPIPAEFERHRGYFQTIYTANGPTRNHVTLGEAYDGT